MTVSIKFYSGSVYSEDDRERAANFLSKGEVVGIFNRGVCALWFDGGSSKAVKKLATIKGEERNKRPIALTLSLEEFIPMIDTNQLPGDLKKLLLSEDLKHRIGSLCFIRAPIKDKYQKEIPKWAKNFEGGFCMIQNWDSFGHEPVEKFLETVKKLGVKHPAVTSMNKTGRPEIVGQMEGEMFAKENNLRIFLKDEKAHPAHIGSYTIFTFDRFGIKLERDGNIPAEVFKYIFGMPINKKNAKMVIHKQLKFNMSEIKKQSATQIRQRILANIAKYV